jgi:hypothetical protein
MVLERLDSLRSSNIADKKPRTAAVMMLLSKNEITHLVLIVRNSYEGVILLK